MCQMGTDVLGANGQRIEFWVWGAFEVRDERIVVWHDYFDWAEFSARALLSLPGLAMRTVARAVSR
jgi:limonene-1,2-epoxide hydrolase